MDNMFSYVHTLTWCPAYDRHSGIFFGRMSGWHKGRKGANIQSLNERDREREGEGGGGERGRGRGRGGGRKEGRKLGRKEGRRKGKEYNP